MTAPDVQTPGGNPASTNQNTDDTQIIGDFAEERKAQATLAAMLALRGFSLLEIAGGGYLVARWDRSAHCSDLAQVRAFYQRAVGGAA